MLHRTRQSRLLSRAGWFVLKIMTIAIFGSINNFWTDMLSCYVFTSGSVADDVCKVEFMGVYNRYYKR